MRRTTAVAATLAVLVVSGGVAQADVTDTVVTAALPGLLTITGTSTLPAAPLGAGSSATIGSAASVGGSQLQVSDLTGKTVGWQVNAKYSDLASGVLSTIPKPEGVLAVKNIGGENVTVTVGTGPLGATNSTAGVADAGLNFTGGNLAATAGTTILSTKADGRGITNFETGYSLNLPAKTTDAATLYTGSILYTVGPKPAV